MTPQFITWLNRFFVPPNTYFGALARSAAEAFEYSIRAGQVVYEQFHGYNDLRNKVVLDLGCGLGGKTVYYATRGPRRTIGVDVAAGWEMAARHAAAHGLQVEFSPLLTDGRINLPDNTCDVVLSSSVLEHLEHPAATLAELRRVLRPGGLLLNRWHPFRTRHGAHVHSAIGIPFAHLLFREASLVQAYVRLLKQHFEKLPPTLRHDFQTATSLNALEFHLNRATVRTMRRTVEDAGFHVVQRRHFWGKRELRYTRFVPERCLDYLIDFEVQICISGKPVSQTVGRVESHRTDAQQTLAARAAAISATVQEPLTAALQVEQAAACASEPTSVE